MAAPYLDGSCAHQYDAFCDLFAKTCSCRKSELEENYQRTVIGLTYMCLSTIQLSNGGCISGVDRKEGKYEMVGAGKDWKECLVDFGFSLLSSSISAAVYGPIVKGNYSSATGKLCSQWIFQASSSSTGDAFKKILLKPPKAINPHVEIDKMTWSFISDNLQ